MFNFLASILNKYKGKRILIVGHSTAIAFLLGKWCEINYNGSYKFKKRVFFDGKWDYDKAEERFEKYIGGWSI